jgi:hypothetical protein
MLDGRVQETIELSRSPKEAPEENSVGRFPFGQRIFSLRNVASASLPLIVLCLVYRELLNLDWREVWSSFKRGPEGRRYTDTTCARSF